MKEAYAELQSELNQLAVAIDQAIRERDKSRELVTKLDAGIARITMALGFAPGGADFDRIVEAIHRLRAERSQPNDR